MDFYRASSDIKCRPLSYTQNGVPKKRPERPRASRASTVAKGWSLFCRHVWWHVDAFWLKPKSVHCTSETKKRPLYFKTQKHPLYSKTKTTVSIISYGSVNSKAVAISSLVKSSTNNQHQKLGLALEMATVSLA